MNFEEYEKDLIIETIEHRLETDETLLYRTRLKENLEDLLDKMEDE